MTTTATPVRTVPLSSLSVRVYASMRNAALVTDAGEILAQAETSPGESPAHLQFRLVEAALATPGTDGRTLAISHGGALTLNLRGALVDYVDPGNGPGELTVEDGELTRAGQRLAPNLVTFENVLEEAP